MKKGIYYIILFAVILAGCKEDVPTVFAEPDGIYFSTPADSLTYTFAKYPNRLSDTLKIPVTVLGNAAGKDRTISLEKLSGTDMNGIEGVHYKLLQPYTLPAGKVSTMLPVVFRHYSVWQKIQAVNAGSGVLSVLKTSSSTRTARY